MLASFSSWLWLLYHDHSDLVLSSELAPWAGLIRPCLFFARSMSYSLRLHIQRSIYRLSSLDYYRLYRALCMAVEVKTMEMRQFAEILKGDERKVCSKIMEKKPYCLFYLFHCLDTIDLSRSSASKFVSVRYFHLQPWDTDLTNMLSYLFLILQLKPTPAFHS